jgi:hypothetical protein
MIERMDTHNRKEIFSEKVQAGRRTYFFDIKETCNGSRYMQLTESKIHEDTFVRHSILVFDDDISAFSEAFIRMALKFKAPADSLEEVSEYNNAYNRWSTTEDETLENLFCEDKTIEELSAHLGRTHGAIRSRIEKLELIEKYR